jgi:hypothetical protein
VDAVNGVLRDMRRIFGRYGVFTEDRPVLTPSMSGYAGQSLLGDFRGAA